MTNAAEAVTPILPTIPELHNVKITPEFPEDKTYAWMPTKGTEGSAAYDLYTAEATIIEPKAEKAVLVSAGFKMAMPVGLCALIMPRSGICNKKRISIPNAPGLIDSDYRGVVKVGLRNDGDTPYYIKRGTRIAQMLFVRAEAVHFEQVYQLDETERGTGGFGHTGE